jgi:hypothetical protein
MALMFPIGHHHVCRCFEYETTLKGQGHKATFDTCCVKYASQLSSVGFTWAVFGTPCVKKMVRHTWQCKAKYASYVTYCPSLEATLSHCVSYLTLCRDRFTVWSSWWCLKIVCFKATIHIVSHPYRCKIRVLRSSKFCYNQEFIWLQTVKALSRIRFLTKRSWSNRTWILISIKELGPSYIDLVMQYIIVNIEVCFSLKQAGHHFLRSAKTWSRMVPEKCGIIKLWLFA